MASDKMRRGVTFANVLAIPDSVACIVSMAFKETTTDAKFASVTNVHRHNACCSANTGFNWTTMGAKHAHVITVHKHNV